MQIRHRLRVLIVPIAVSTAELTACSSTELTPTSADVSATPRCDVTDAPRRGSDEVGVDCGGSCSTCNDKACSSAPACQNRDTCDGAAKTCAAPSANDGKKDGDESDVDCGGTAAPACAVNRSCVTDSDCGFKTCQLNRCGLPTASDGKKNGNESDVDCGGAAMEFDGVTLTSAPRCADAKSCLVDADCTNIVCSENKRCVEAPSCRNYRGGYTCGTGETGTAEAVHESCCTSYPVPGVTLTLGGVPKPVYLDKYEITAGRVRAWLSDIRKQYNGEPNVQKWIQERKVHDPYLATILPASIMGALPKQNENQPIVDASGSFVQYKVNPLLLKDSTSEFFGAKVADPNKFYVTRDAGLYAQIGPTSYFRGVTVVGTSGCAMYDSGYGHRTYHDGPDVSRYFLEPARNAITLAELDDKSMNCLSSLMYAAFCAWDGGYLQSQDAVGAAYGPARWPWGDSPVTSLDSNNRPQIIGSSMVGNYNFGVSGLGDTKRPAYNWPALDPGIWPLDFTPLIAPPGRFAADIASRSRPGQPSWMDMGSNMLELAQREGAMVGRFGSSWEGHVFPRGWDVNSVSTNTIVPELMDKYGKIGARCMRIR